MYFVKTPAWLKVIFNAYTWHIRTKERELYLTFDDGPHPAATPFVLEQLEKFNAKATFFCLGKNVLEYNAIYEQIIKKGHSIGNHTNNHLNGWNVTHDEYINNIDLASTYIKSDLFRPPYGRISRKAGRTLLQKNYKIVMWDVLSGDFDAKISPEKCSANVVNKAKNGSIIVFHDSQKAFKNMSYALPLVLEYFSSKGFVFKSLKRN
ncbi:polysaccharide deacetylase family protein [Niabella ginsengisoli]|uniref:Polysaccharide deacetylase family protein n=1 Tax=Niabella ginsengisoli TaxID=522298 RepID=A0ABS9SM45_9BACT|nr:polysaccharide deacetylase family protein [Niabella ginsengisoli]MCH5599432.1 polysaccharide deacetylase family protein [Niabella ginsengisoli]